MNANTEDVGVTLVKSALHNVTYIHYRLYLETVMHLITIMSTCINVCKLFIENNTLLELF